MTRTTRPKVPAASPTPNHMPTSFLLLAQYGGRAMLTVDEVCRDFFAHLTPDALMRKVSSGDVRIPVVRTDAGSQKNGEGGPSVRPGGLPRRAPRRRKEGDDADHGQQIGLLMTGRNAFRQADLVRALKAAGKAGLTVHQFKIYPDGRIVVMTGEPEPAARNYLAEWQASRARQRRLAVQELPGWDDVVDGTAFAASVAKPPTRSRRR